MIGKIQKYNYIWICKVAHDNLDFLKIILTLSILLMVIRVSVIVNTKGIAVKYVDDVKDELKNYKIIIMTANRNVELVGKDLEKLGFISGGKLLFNGTVSHRMVLEI